MTERSFERVLTETARAVIYPQSPELSRQVGAALRQQALGRRARARRLALTYAVLAGVLVLAIAALAITPTREAIARLFGVEGSRIEFLPTALSGETATPFPTPVLNLTPNPRNVSPLDVEILPALVGFAAALPQVSEERIESALLFYGHDAVVVHSYPSFELWQSRLEGQAGFSKLAPPGVRLQDVSVGGWSGYWLSGGEHYVSYVDAEGIVVAESSRVVERSTLIWRTDVFFYRIETDLSRDDAIRIAVTLP